MRTAVVVAILLAIFIALVQWRRHYSERVLPKGMAAGVSVERVRRVAEARPLTAQQRSGSSSTRGASAAHGSAAPDAGARPEGAPTDGTEAPVDLEAGRKRAQAAMDAIQQLMDAERRDDDWARGVESWARANYGKRPGSHLERVECKKTLCSADGDHDTEQAYREWVSRFTGHDRGLRVMTMPTVLTSGKTHARTFILKDDGARPR